MRIARLEYEFVLRQNLTNECANLEKEKDKAAVNIDTTKKKLDSLQPLLSAVLDVSPTKFTYHFLLFVLSECMFFMSNFFLVVD